MAQRRSSNSTMMVFPCNFESEDDHEDQKQKQYTPSFDSLPNDIIANILLRVSPQLLYNSARFVCKTWSEIISQLHSSSHSSHSGFLIQDSHSPNKAQFVYIIKEWDIKVTDLNLNFPGKISGSSDGVLLISSSSSSSNNSVQGLYVANPVTKQVLKLPILPSTCRLCGHINNIASIPSTGEIKVVSLSREPNGIYNWYAITLEKNTKSMSWRKIISDTCSEESNDNNDPASYLSFLQSLSVDGTIFWTNPSWIMNRSILAIDLHNETVRNLRVPKQCDTNDGGEYWKLVQMGKKMCLMNYGENVEGIMKIWELKDLHRNEWVWVNSVRFCEESPLRRKFCIPLVWVDSQVVILSVVVRASNVVVAYHVRKKEYKMIKVDDVARHQIFYHINSLRPF